MNNRGKKLSDLELLKNRLIHLTSLYSDAEVKENDEMQYGKTLIRHGRGVLPTRSDDKLNPLNDDEFLRATNWVMYFILYSLKS